MFFGCRLVLLMAAALLGASSAESGDIVIDVVWQGNTILLEEPHYALETNVLYWVDVTKQVVHRKDLTTGEVTSRYIDGGPVSPVIPVAGKPNELVLGVGREIRLFYWNTGRSTFLGSVDEDQPNNIFNDGKADAVGRLWWGTKSPTPNLANFYVVTAENLPNPEVAEAGVTISNGLAWNKDNTLMYYIDSEVKRLDVFDFDLNEGVIRNRRPVFDLSANGIFGLPDGMTIDTDENLWVAVYNGSRILKISPEGELLSQIMMPATEITSVAWGGPDLDILFVTSARQEEIHFNEEFAGALFSVTGTGARGRPAFESRITEY